MVNRQITYLNRSLFFDNKYMGKGVISTAKECLDSRSGLEYRGMNSTPFIGGSCLHWSSQEHYFKWATPLIDTVTGIDV